MVEGGAHRPHRALLPQGRRRDATAVGARAPPGLPPASRQGRARPAPPDGVVVTRAATFALAALALVACRGTDVSMSSVPPPASWAEWLASERQERDHDFARDPDSPLPKSEPA